MEVYVKISGSICIAVAVALAEQQIENKWKRNAAILRDMYELLVFLEKETVYRRTPIQEALKQAAERCSLDLKNILFHTVSMIQEKSGKPFAVIWEEAVEQETSGRFIDQKQKRAIIQAEEALCNTDTVMQRTLLQKHAAKFYEMGQRSEAQFREKSSLYRKLGAVAGAFFILLFL